MTNASLNGKHFLVLRPENTSDTLLQVLREAGGKVSHYPMLVLDSCRSGALKDMLDHISQVRKLIFVSPSAVKFFMQHLSEANAKLPDNVQCFAPGLSTAEVLREAGVSDIFYPKNVGDATSVLAMPELSDIDEELIGVLGSESGNHGIVIELQRRGANAKYISCYRSLPAQPVGDRILEAHRTDPFSALIVHSSMAFKNLVSMLGNGIDRLLTTPVLTHHQAIFRLAENQGFSQVHIADNGKGEAFVDLAQQVLS